jgi:glucokinase
MRDKTILVWDLGATKSAAAVVRYNTETKKLYCERSCSIALSSTASLRALSEAIEEKLGIKHREADAICIGAAGVYDGEYLRLDKGYPYAMPFASLAKESSWPIFAIIHDYALIVCATFSPDIAVKTIISGEGDSFGRRIAFGVGTGLGLKDGVLGRNGDFWLGTNEIGHIGIAEPLAIPESVKKVHQALTKEQALSFEAVLSGSGMLRLHQFLYPGCRMHSPEALGELLRDGEGLQTLSVFAFYLGLFTSTVQLAFMPSGGIFIAGGVIMKHLSLFDYPEYFQGISAFPAYSAERSKYPLKVLIDEKTPFIGGAFYALKRLIVCS